MRFEMLLDKKKSRNLFTPFKVWVRLMCTKNYYFKPLKNKPTIQILDKNVWAKRPKSDVKIKQE